MALHVMLLAGGGMGQLDNLTVKTGEQLGQASGICKRPSSGGTAGRALHGDLLSANLIIMTFRSNS